MPTFCAAEVSSKRPFFSACVLHLAVVMFVVVGGGGQWKDRNICSNNTVRSDGAYSL